MTEQDIIAAIREKLTVPLYPHAAQALGLSRGSAYEAAKNGEIATIRIGRLVRVPTAPLRKLLGIEQPASAAPAEKAA